MCFRATAAAHETTATPKVSTPTPKCPPFAGTWVGSFDGDFSGVWAANVLQTRTHASAAATVEVYGVGEFVAEGDVQVSCANGETELVGIGTAAGRSGAFWGTIDRPGRKVSGTWNGAGRSGTWRGERSGRKRE